jgi:hypothetical protein
MILKSTALNNIFASKLNVKNIGVIILINGLNAIIEESNGSKVPVTLLNSSFLIGQTVLCSNQIVQRVINKQRAIKTVRV